MLITFCCLRFAWDFNFGCLGDRFLLGFVVFTLQLVGFLNCDCACGGGCLCGFGF